MYKYAQFDLETGRCIGVSLLAGEVEANHMILLDDETDVLPGDIYTDGEWTRPEQRLPQGPASSATLEAENHLLKTQNQVLSDRAEFIEDVIAEIAIEIYQ